MGRRWIVLRTISHSEQLIGILQQASDSPVAVVAWSYSTHVVLHTLIERPDLISKALIYEPGLHTYLHDPADLEAYGADAHAAFGPIVQALQSGGPEAAVEGLFESSGGEGCFVSLSAERRQRYLASSRIMPLLLGGGKPPAPITAADLGRIEVPVTVAHGARTRPLFAIASRAVAQAIKGARLEVVADGDHMLPERQPERFAALIDKWLAD